MVAGVLGVTAVELLPVQESISEGTLIEMGLCNYWGYHTLAFFAPDRHRRLAAPPRRSPGHRTGLEAHRPLTLGQRGQRLPHQLVPRRSAPLR